MRWLVRFGYDGSEYYGWARQPGLRTVEGTIRAGLRAGRSPEPVDLRELEVASRTDRGVHARANALTLRSTLEPGALLRRLNAVAPSIFFTAAAPVSEEFRVRHAVRRTYRYFDAEPFRQPAQVEKACRLLVGEVDARSFGRGFPAERPRWSVVEAIELSATDSGVRVEVRAPSFVWGMVRKIVGALREVDHGRLTLARLESAARGRQRLTLPLATPDGLVLWEVEFPVTWSTLWHGPNRYQQAERRGQLRELRIRTQILEGLYPPAVA